MDRGDRTPNRLSLLRTRVGKPAGRVLALGMPLVLASSLDLGAMGTAGAMAPAPGTESVRPDPSWLAGLTGPVRTMRGALPADEVPPDTAVVPVNGDPQVLVLAGPGAAGSAPAGPTAETMALTSSGIPVRVLRAYVAAAQIMAAKDPTCRIPWSLLAGIGRVESNHGRFGGAKVGTDGRVSPPIVGLRLDGSGGVGVIHDTDHGVYDGDASYDRAVGPMQFIPGTWAGYGADANGDGRRDPQNVDDAALGAARYLCAGSGSLATPTGRWNAVYRYNHSASYVSLVLGLADSYAAGTPTALPTAPSGVTTPTDPPATVGPPPAAQVPPQTPPQTPPKTPAPRPTSIGTPPPISSSPAPSTPVPAPTTDTPAPSSPAPPSPDPTPPDPTPADPTPADPTPPDPTTPDPTPATPDPTDPVTAVPPDPVTTAPADPVTPASTDAPPPELP